MSSDNTKPNYRLRSRIALGICAVLLTVAVGGALWLFSLYQTGTHLSPAPQGNAYAHVAHPTPGNPYADFPEVDWGYWQGINSDVVGWITIPDTGIDYPIVQEHKDSVGYYLDHDIYGNWSYVGVPFLDADCESLGLNSTNCPIAAHNMQGADAMFAPLASFIDKDWASAHKEVWIQTPTWKKRLSVQAAAIVPGWEELPATSFKDGRSFASWWEARFSESSMRLQDRPGSGGQLFTLYTCSYTTWAWNERTVVYAMEVQP